MDILHPTKDANRYYHVRVPSILSLWLKFGVRLMICHHFHAYGFFFFEECMIDAMVLESKSMLFGQTTHDIIYTSFSVNPKINVR